MRPKIRKHSLIYSNKHVGVYLDTIRVNENNFEYVYLQKPNINAIGVIPVTKKGIYLVKQYRYPVKRYMWQIILGAIDNGETVEDAARRELKEEAGILAGKIKKIGTVLAEPGLVAQETYIFKAENLNFVKSSPNLEETGLELRLFSYKKIKQMIEASEIQCGFTISSVYFLDN